MKKTKVLVLGAGGAIAQHVIELLENDKNIELTLFARDVSRLNEYKSFANIIGGDVLDKNDLQQAMQGQHIVYANLSGQVDKMAKVIVTSMEANKVNRLIFVTALGIYNEIPGKFGQWNEKMIGSDLVRYRHAADAIEASLLDYTIVRPAWLTDKNEIDFELTHKGEPFKGTEVSRRSVGAFIADVLVHPEKEVRASIGIDKPGTEGNKPAFY
ncbi:MAG: SDR family oxidoreductase [Chitinophagaceae bacterium]